jgi:glycosyltransferase involved in cell wall biosynthesis
MQEVNISIVIPTHNRCASLQRLLNKVQGQDYPKHLMQVIVAADGCTDNTIDMLKAYNPAYAFSWVQLPGSGAAVARNSGAALATGDLLLFIDDDIDPSDTLVQAHVRQYEPNRVVIGYLPLTNDKTDFYSLTLREWWEMKFEQMQEIGYRFSYEDLLSGNFSVPLKLFKEINGFDVCLRCREDYELGLRLIKAGGEFKFAKNAWGYHRDLITNLHRSLQRKAEEGKYDVQFWNIHPQFVSDLQKDFQKRGSRRQIKIMVLIGKLHMITDVIAWTFEKLLTVLEWLRLRIQWRKVNYKLHMYWYKRGVVSQLKSEAAITHYLESSFTPTNAYDLSIDLQKGWAQAEALLDQKRPKSVQVLLGEDQVCIIKDRPGFESLKGSHLRPLLANRYANQLMKALAFQELQKKN